MVDVISKKQRSYVMSRIRSKWTLVERNTHSYLKAFHVKHQMHPKMFGNPDILLKKKNVVIFLDGCFWHGCPQCYTEPKSNIVFWRNKIKRNKRNDLRTTRRLKRMGWKVIRIWEHKLKHKEQIVNEIHSMQLK